MVVLLVPFTAHAISTCCRSMLLCLSHCSFKFYKILHRSNQNKKCICMYKCQRNRSRNHDPWNDDQRNHDQRSLKPGHTPCFFARSMALVKRKKRKSKRPGRERNPHGLSQSKRHGNKWRWRALFPLAVAPQKVGSCWGGHEHSMENMENEHA